MNTKKKKAAPDAATSRTARRWKNAPRHNFTAPSLPQKEGVNQWLKYPDI